MSDDESEAGPETGAEEPWTSDDSTSPPGGDTAELGSDDSFLRALVAAPSVDPAVLRPWPRPGDMLGHLRIDAVLGEGGMGVVYQAWDTRLSRPVALKFLKLWPAGATERRQVLSGLLEEGRRVAALDHRNIVTVYSADEIDGRLCLTMQALDGRTLAQRIKEGPLPADEAAALMLQAAQGLDHAHRLSTPIIHRDVKPSNLFLTDRGVLKILDFGIARFIDEETTGGDRGALVGTLPYVAPEVCAGQTADARSDLYSLGITWYELLTGAPPFKGSPSDVVWGHLHSAPPPPERPVPREAWAIVRRLLAKDPAERYPDAASLTAALRSAFPHLEGPAAPAGARPQASDNPYRGLAAFGPEHAERFFGREALVGRLVETLEGMRQGGEGAPPRVLPLVGPSGSGKSSVALAGLVPWLRGAEGGGARVVVLSPGAAPVASLAEALGPGAQPPLSRLSGAEAVAARLLAEGPGLALVVDQFEEVFTLCTHEAERRALVEGLLAACQAPGGPIAILTLRSDFLRHTQPFPILNQAIARTGVIIPVLDAAALEEAIARPASAVGWPLDPATVSLMVQQSSGREGALPLLQFTLWRVWEGMAEGRGAASTVAELGGVGGALATEAQRLFDTLPEERRGRARRLLLSLVEVGEEGEIARRRVPVSDLVHHGEEPEAVRQLLLAFSAPGARLITLSNPGGDVEHAEVSHEALFTHWDTFRQWLALERSSLRLALQLDEATREWDDAGRPDGLLWRPPKLDHLKEAEREGLIQLNSRQRAFADAAYDLEFTRSAELDLHAQRARELDRLRRLQQSQQIEISELRRLRWAVDPTHRVRSRMVWTAVVCSLGGLLPIFGGRLQAAGLLTVDHGLHVMGLVLVTVACAVGVIRLRRAGGALFNNALVAGVLIGVGVMYAWQLVMALIGAPMLYVYYGDMAITLHLFSSLGLTFDRRLLWAAPWYLAAVVLAGMAPQYVLELYGAANLLGGATATLAWQRRRGPVAGDG